jgi:hypothetical protein
MTVQLPLDSNASEFFNAQGIARLFMGPKVFGETWRVRRMTVTTDSVGDTDARVYLNSEIPTRMVAGTFTGNRDFNETDITLQNLDTFIVVWNGGTAGARADFLIQGIKER